MQPRRWPDRLWIVRHGQSAGNVARDLADAAGRAVIDIAERDVDVPLSALGHEQAAALGRWFAAQPEGERPTVVLASPYLRARQTARAVCDAGGVRPAARWPSSVRALTPSSASCAARSSVSGAAGLPVAVVSAGPISGASRSGPSSSSAGGGGGAELALAMFA